MNNKLTKRFRVAEPKDIMTYRITVYPDEYKKYVDKEGDTFIKEPLYFVVTIRRLKKGYFEAVAGFEGKLFTHCSRCLDEAEVDLNLEMKRAYKYSEYGSGETDDLIFYDTVYIDLFGFFLDEIFLAVPSYVLCKDDCKGLCEICGENLNKNSCIHVKNEL